MTRRLSLASVMNDPDVAAVDTDGVGLMVGSGIANQVGIYAGSGAPSFAAPKGSIYMNTAGGSSSTRIYVCSVASGTWVAVTTAS